MSKTSMDSGNVVLMMKSVSERMVASKDILTEADRMGDADHGEGMARGFTEARRVLAESPGETVAAIMKSIGVALMMKIGGAAGAIFGTMFSAGATGIEEGSEFDSEALAAFLNKGLEAVKKRGKASLGQKTMVDALEPAANAAADRTGHPIGDALRSAAHAAEAGKEKTRDMIATTGKAKTLGERSLGHPDPGAVSVALILSFMRDYVDNHL